MDRRIFLGVFVGGFIGAFTYTHINDVKHAHDIQVLEKFMDTGQITISYGIIWLFDSQQNRTGVALTDDHGNSLAVAGEGTALTPWFKPSTSAPRIPYASRG